MLTQPNIMVATDFSEFSHLALQAGEEIRRKTGGQLQLVHVTDYPDQWDWMTNDVVINYYPQELKDRLINEIKARMEKQMRDTEATGSIEIVIGPTHKGLLGQSDQFGADLLIIGHKGSGKHAHLGSIAAKMITASERPVLVINRPFRTQKIAGLIDTSKPEDRRKRRESFLNRRRRLFSEDRSSDHFFKGIGRDRTSGKCSHRFHLLINLWLIEILLVRLRKFDVLERLCLSGESRQEKSKHPYSLHTHSMCKSDRLS